MATTQLEVEEIESTKSEKALAVVLTAFLLIGAIWTYAKIDDVARSSIAQPHLTAREAEATRSYDLAQARAFSDQNLVTQARSELELAREAYRTALDAGRTAPELERRYAQAQKRYEQAQARLRQARAAASSLEPAARQATQRYGESQRSASDRQALIAGVLRLAFTAALLVFGYWLLARLRRRHTRYLPLAFAVIGTAAILALVLAGDYVTDYVDPLELGPLVLSLFGIATTIVAFAVLQRYLTRRVPVRRVRKGECPFCGFPVRAGGTHCEGCGREVLAGCATCGSARRVGTAHCAACGAT